MRNVASSILSGLAIFTFTNVAEAQVICSLIEKYFKNPPQGFINERGEEISEGHWRSNQSFPNSTCSISQIDSWHLARCTINRGASLDTVVAFGKSVESDIDSCLQQIPEGKNYKKRVNTNTDDGLTGTTTKWEYEASNATYEISVSAVKSNSKGYLYNTLAVGWDQR